MITVARTGPASAISAKKSRNAIAVQRIASPTTDSVTSVEGNLLGSDVAANGR